MKRVFSLRSLRHVALLGLVGLVCRAYAGGPAVGLPAGPEQFTLTNGMTLIVQPDHRAPTVAHMLWVRVGSLDEVDGSSGVAHVLEHMMFKGTPDLKPGEFSRRVAALGGRENAFTSRDATAYHQQVGREHLEAVMRLEADRFARNQWTDEEFHKELEVVKEERRQRTEESPRARFFEAVSAQVFQTSPYRRPVIGWMSDLDALTPQDARDFYRRWYVPANAAVVIAGDVDVARVRELAEAIYGRIPPGAVPPRKPREEVPQQGARRMEFRAAAEQAMVNLAWHAPKLADPAGRDAGSQDALALAVLAAVLDGYGVNRLERALVQARQPGIARLADSVGASYGLFGRGPQLFSLTAVPARGMDADRVAQALRREVDRIAREGVTAAELERVKTQWAASETYQLDSVFNQARELGSAWVNGWGVDAGPVLMARLQEVTAEQVQSVARRLFAPDRLNTAVLVPDASRATAPRPGPRPALPDH